MASNESRCKSCTGMFLVSGMIPVGLTDLYCKPCNALFVQPTLEDAIEAGLVEPRPAGKGKPKRTAK